MNRLLAGIFVGGKARRMGGFPKGMLAHPTNPGSVIDHVIGQARATGAEPMLVGRDSTYDSLGLPWVQDEVENVGPAGGLLALLRHADDAIVLALACDLPYLSSELLEELVEGVRGGAPVVVPRRGGKLEPLCAAYRAGLVVGHVEDCLAGGIRSLHRIVRAAGAVELELEEPRARWLDDWDRPEDLAR